MFAQNHKVKRRRGRQRWSIFLPVSVSPTEISFNLCLNYTKIRKAAALIGHFSPALSFNRGQPKGLPLHVRCDTGVGYKV